MNFGFSYVGLIFLIMLFVPNLFWTKHKPKDYDQYSQKENRFLLVLERFGEISVSCLVLIFSDYNARGLDWWLLWLLGALLLMILYEIFWIRYFMSPKTMKDFYRSILGIPLAGATLPVIAVLFIAIYGGNLCLLIAGVVLGIGHIGIHTQHRIEINKTL